MLFSSIYVITRKRFSCGLIREILYIIFRDRYSDDNGCKPDRDNSSQRHRKI